MLYWSVTHQLVLWCEQNHIYYINTRHNQVLVYLYVLTFISVDKDQYTAKCFWCEIKETQIRVIDSSKKITWSKVLADHMIKSPCKIRAIRLSLKLEIAMLARTILLLSMLNFNFCQGAKYYPSLPNHGIYRCNFPCFKSCVIIRGQPNMRDISLFDCDVKILKIEWPHTGPLIRDRFNNIWKDKCIYIYFKYFPL